MRIELSRRENKMDELCKLNEWVIELAEPLEGEVFSAASSSGEQEVGS
ncbi:hypothetical protein [Paraburkholderia sp. DGU8]